MTELKCLDYGTPTVTWLWTMIQHRWSCLNLSTNQKPVNSHVWYPGGPGDCRRWPHPRCPGDASQPICSQTGRPAATPPPAGSSSACPAILPWLSLSTSAVSDLLSGRWHGWTSVDKVGMFYVVVGLSITTPGQQHYQHWTGLRSMSAYEVMIDANSFKFPRKQLLCLLGIQLTWAILLLKLFKNFILIIVRGYQFQNQHVCFPFSHWKQGNTDNISHIHYKSSIKREQNKQLIVKKTKTKLNSIS